jgi:hypothetical protein
MTRRKREITGLANEQDFPHLVELALPPGGFRSVFLEIDAFHRERRIPVRRGRSRHEAERFHIRFCFPDTVASLRAHPRLRADARGRDRGVRQELAAGIMDCLGDGAKVSGLCCAQGIGARCQERK